VIDERVPGFLRWLATPAGRVPVIASALGAADRVGAWKARWGIGRLSYLVPPGLYAIGDPSPRDPVLVTANYKMSYDLVRRELAGRNVWLLVLETHGINVWCAAGKGTFGTEELVARIGAARLGEIVAHRSLTLPLLGAPGVSGHEVRARTGFAVQFAAVRAGDLPRYLDDGLRATPQMRELSFTLGERLVLVPVELVQALKASLWVVPPLALATSWRGGGFAPAASLPALLGYLGAVAVGTILTPLALPWLPTRSFSVKGAVAGLLWALVFVAASGWRGAAAGAAVLLLVAVSSFFALNFTGCTPFTSISGVKKELRFAMPVLAVSVAAGLVLAVVAAMS
jgi:acetyl-CoA decarbonylase/synthase complex subunit gamma